MRIIVLVLIIAGCSKGPYEDTSEVIVGRLAPAEVDLPESFEEVYLFEDGDPERPKLQLQKYEVKVPLWTDGAKKERFIFLPTGSTTSFDADKKRFVFPVGTSLVKNFSTAEGEMVESRLMVKKSDGSWAFATYVWSGDEATKNQYPQTVKFSGVDYRIPSEKECKLCHENIEGVDPVLGVRPEQLNFGSQNQLNNLLSTGFFEAESSRDIDALPDPTDESHSLEERVKSYLHANCAMCHQPGAAADEKGFDLRFETTFADSQLVEKNIIKKGSFKDSLLWKKFIAETERMPPLSIREDALGRQLIEQWIDSL